MLRELIEKEAVAVRDAVHAIREWVHPTRTATLERPPVDETGRAIEEATDDEIDAHLERMVH